MTGSVSPFLLVVISFCPWEFASHISLLLVHVVITINLYWLVKRGTLWRVILATSHARIMSYFPPWATASTSMWHRALNSKYCYTVDFLSTGSHFWSFWAAATVCRSPSVQRRTLRLAGGLENQLLPIHGIDEHVLQVVCDIVHEIIKSFYTLKHVRVYIYIYTWLTSKSTWAWTNANM